MTPPTALIGLPALYAFTGLVFATYAMLGLADRSNPKRFGNFAFWGLLATSMLAGDRLGDLGNDSSSPASPALILTSRTPASRKE